MNPQDPVEEAGLESFPASDPPAWSEAAKRVNASWQQDPKHSLRVDSAEGSFDAYITRPDRLPRPAVVVLHEVFGVNADMRATCAELAEAGYIAICPDLFWRQERGVDLSVTSAEDWKKGVALYQAYDLDAGVRDIEATIRAARSLKECSGRVGVMGYCLGGLLTFLTLARTRVDAGVAYHGGRTEEFLGEADRIQAPLLMHLAEEDEFIPKRAQQQIKTRLAGKSQAEIYSYAGCRHAFARHGGTHYDAGAAKAANGRTVAFLNRELG